MVVTAEQVASISQFVPESVLFPALLHFFLRTSFEVGIGETEIWGG